MKRRNALHIRDFLQSRRARVHPQLLRSRRRVVGLRREEVAEHAGIGSTYYAYIEQGRMVHPSPEVIRRIGSALHLSAAETRYFEQLIGDELVVPVSCEELAARWGGVLCAFEAGPAMLISGSLDIVACNRLTDAFFGEYQTAVGLERNMLWRLFTSPARRSLEIDWEVTARSTVGWFRANYGRVSDTKRFDEVSEALLARSNDFRRLWNEYPFGPVFSPTNRGFLHPIIGPVTLETVSVEIPDSGGAVLVFKTPKTADDASALQRL